MLLLYAVVISQTMKIKEQSSMHSTSKICNLCRNIWLTAMMVALVFVKLSESAGQLNILFLRYVSDGRIATGGLCASTGRCNPQFQVEIQRDRDGGPEIFNYQQAGFYNNQNTVDFDSTFGERSNPLVVGINYNDNQGSAWIKINIRNVLAGNRFEPMSQFSALIALSGPDVRNLELKNNLNQSLTIRYWFRCNGNYFDPLCDTFCAASDDDKTGHFGCDANGQIVCRYGWVDPSSECKQLHPCRTCVCQNGGVCVPEGSKGYKCTCPASFYGNNCEHCYPGMSCPTPPTNSTCDPFPSKCTDCPADKCDGISVGVLIGSIVGTICLCITLKCCLLCCCRGGYTSI